MSLSLANLHKLHHVIRRPGYWTAVLLAVVVFATFAQQTNVPRSLLLGFNAGALFYVAFAFYMISTTHASAIKQRAIHQEEGKWAALLISIVVAGVVLVALSMELHGAKNKSIWDVAVAGSTILLTWFFVALVFAQEYAHSYYMAGAGLGFPGTPEPDYWDVTYFSVVLSMACQTSDVTITTRPMRRLVLLHSVIAFFFNVIILAITVNVVAGLL
ncbi:MAG: hypothetical protein RL761_1072 [Pseudomonadota bacterium]|jgi:uncharacterized membrane protein